MQQILTPKESILVIDDTPANLRLLARLLAGKGYQVRFSPSVNFALKTIQAKLPDLILLDVKMPDRDGYEVCQILKADNRTRNIPVIFISALGDALDKVKAFSAGGADYITKPFHSEEVVARIENQLNIQRLQKQLIEQNLRLQQAVCQREQAEQLLEQQFQRTLLIQQITELICSQLDGQSIFETVVKQIGQVLQVSRCSLHIYVPPPIPEIPLIAEYTVPSCVSMRQLDFALEDNLFIPEVLSQDRALVSINVYQDDRLASIQSLCHLTHMQSLVAVRTAYHNQANGVLMLQQCDRQRIWTSEEIALLEAIADQLGIALAQAKSIDQEQKQLEALEYQNLILRQEICERRQIEAALQDSETELRDLFAAMSDVILVLDHKGKYLKIAPTNHNNFYMPPECLLGKTLHEIFPIDQADQFLSYIQASLDSRQSVECEYDLLIDKRIVWFSAKISPSGNDTVIWVARDITARKQAEAELLNKSLALSEFSNNLKQLHRLGLTDFETIEELCTDYLKTGCEILGFSSGIISRIEGLSYRVLTGYFNGSCLLSGIEASLQNTYCQAVVQTQQTMGYQHTDFLDKTFLQSCLPNLQVNSYIGTPIWVDGEIYGTLCFFADRPRLQGYQNHEQEIIELMAQSIGKFISVHQVNAKQHQAEEEVQLLLDITQAITAAPDFTQALQAAVEGLCEATGWTYGEVWLPSADGCVLECSPVWYCNRIEQSPAVLASVQHLRQSYHNVTFQPHEGIAGRVWAQQQPEWTLDVEDKTSPAFVLTGHQSQYRFQLVNHYGIKARLGVPITVTRDRNTQLDNLSVSGQNHPAVLAVLVFFTIEARQQDQRLIQVVSAVAAQLGSVLAQKQAEAELRALFTAMNDVVLVRDAKGQCLKVASTNPTLSKPAASILGKTLHETLPIPIANRVLQSIQTSLALRTPVNLEYTLQQQDREVCLSSSISPLSEDSVLIVARDISDRKQVEQALAKRERFLAVLVEVQHELLTFREQPIQYHEILQLLGQVAAASRVYLYETRAEMSQASLIQRAVWNAESHLLVHQLPAHQSALPECLSEANYAQWMQYLTEGQAIGDAVEKLSESEQAFLAAQGILSILILPLMVNGKLWGFVGFESCAQSHQWDALDVSLLNTAVSAIALHCERKSAEDALRQSAAREQATLRVIERMRQTLEIEQIFRATTEELRQLLQCDRVLLYRFNPDWSGCCVAESVAAGWNAVLEPTPTYSGFLSQAINGDRCTVKVWEQEAQVYDTYLQETQGGAYSQGAKYLCVSNIYQEKFSACYLELLEKLQTKAYLTVPIFQGNRLWGLLAAYENSDFRDWLPGEIHLVTHISTQLGVAIQQADLLIQTQQQSEDLKKARDEAEAANRAKTQFLANMSHELRTPLNSILGFTQLINQEAELNPEHREYLHIIDHSGQHLLELINEVLEISRLEADRASLQENSFDLRELVENLREMLRIPAAEKQLQLTVDIADNVPQQIKADQGKLRQVLLNLLDNAIKFTDKGQVNLRVQCSTHEDADFVVALRFEVEDTGFGIAPEEMASLFEAFVQTESGRQSNRGTGLGLAISDRFVQLMGGKLQVRSVPGEGSVFEFEIPVREEIFTQRAEQLGLHCIYGEEESISLPPKLAPADLTVMSAEWIARLYQAASGCSDRQVLQLLEQIPATYHNLAESLEELVYDFRFEDIIELAKFHMQ